MRDCDGCTKCCEGYLPAIVNGLQIYPNGCKFVEANVGCTIYDSRPERPCKTYKCFWVNNDFVPENLKPSITNMIISRSTVLGFNELVLIPAGGYSEELVDWFADYTTKNNINATWQKDGKQFFSGSEEYIAKRREEDRKNYERLNPKDS